MINGKNIAIVGIGQEGVCVANYLHSKNKISLLDQKRENQINPNVIKSLRLKKAKLYFSGKVPHNEKFDIIIRSPGVKPDSSQIKLIISKNSVITSPTNIFLNECPCPVIGVTGTKGKGTTSTLIYEILKADGRDVFLAGNIGIPALEILPMLKKGSLAILELSSFQLMDVEKSPHIAVVLMITSEHMDWHRTDEEYVNAKSNIVKFQTADDYSVINSDFPKSKAMAKKTKAKVFFFSQSEETNGVWEKNGDIISSIINAKTVIKTQEILLPGKHNVQNAMAAIATANILGVKAENINNVLKSFKGLEHRLELAGVINGVKYYNDSFSTTPETTIAAIESFSQPKILILGGSSKNSNFQDLGAKISSDKSIKGIILIGDEAKSIKSKISEPPPYLKEDAKNLKDVINQAMEIAQNGDVVLFSPACASFDMFENYKQRGELFKAEVKKYL